MKRDSPFHIDLLQNELLLRKKSNPRYSLRAFSNFLGLCPSTLSRILSRTQDLSLSSVKSIVKKLKLQQEECVIFIMSVAEEKKLKMIQDICHAVDGSNQLNGLETALSLVPTDDLVMVCDKDGKCLQLNDHAYIIPFS